MWTYRWLDLTGWAGHNRPVPLLLKPKLICRMYTKCSLCPFWVISYSISKSFRGIREVVKAFSRVAFMPPPLNKMVTWCLVIKLSRIWCCEHRPNWNRVIALWSTTSLPAESAYSHMVSRQLVYTIHGLIIISSTYI